MRNIKINLGRASGSAWLLCVAVVLLFSSNARAGKVVLRIRAGNGLDEPKKVEIKSNLPPLVSTNDIISLGGLDLGYDVKNDVYYVHKEVELGAKDARMYEVEINDIWTISKEDIAVLRKQTAELVGKLKGLSNYDTAAELQKNVEQNLAQVEQSQAENVIKSGVDAKKHIMTYESDLAVMKQAKKDVRRIENFVLSAGLDPGALVEDGKVVQPLKRDVALPLDKYGAAVYTITVVNKSPTEPRTISLDRDLPPEIMAADIMDSAGLEIRMDSKTGRAFVYKHKLDLLPGQIATFDIKIRDKWNVNAPRIPVLRANASNVLDRITAKAKYQSIEQTLRTLISELDQISAEQGPKDLNDKYVAFYREQAARLDTIEQKIARIEAALKPIERTSKMGFPGKPPTTKTTWAIILSIILFLFTLSLLFFLRWYGKAPDEKMAASSKAPDEP